ncbi:hypothetical protein ACIQRS_25600 [Streptomyces termitum]|uniref:Uncharacterized protein n=1 Tax=Streptomyces termitum TaxID=67368 RepID=A0A918T7V9_9ACTN|nr:hypothetical protein [Streptomyces termitum]GHB07256.1 hypothetical protein GCM10010305_57960 [Streptomyces termitum]
MRKLLAAVAAATAIVLTVASPASATITGGRDGRIFLAVAHDGGILHDATVSTEGHFAIDRFTLDGPGIRQSARGTNGTRTFSLTNRQVAYNSQICGQGYLDGRSLGRACVRIR